MRVGVWTHTECVRFAADIVTLIQPQRWLRRRVEVGSSGTFRQIRDNHLLFASARKKPFNR